MVNIIKSLAMATGMAAAVVFTQQVTAGNEDLAAAATNPVSNLDQFRLQNQFAPESYNADSWSNATLVQAVVPLPSISSKFDSLTGIVTRTTAPFIATPKLPNGVNRKNGWGDTQTQIFFVPKKSPKKTIWGVGPAFTFPTAGDNEFTGSGQWQAGPTAVVMVTPVPGLQVGALVIQQWDFHETRSDAADQSLLSFQPILTKHFSGGWYVAAPDVPQVYNWKTNDWSLNLGGVVGRVGPVYGMPMQIYGGVYYNTEDNDTVSSEWIFKATFGFLFPH
jgi:hypothetical protein